MCRAENGRRGIKTIKTTTGWWSRTIKATLLWKQQQQITVGTPCALSLPVCLSVPVRQLVADEWHTTSPSLQQPLFLQRTQWAQRLSDITFKSFSPFFLYSLTIYFITTDLTVFYLLYDTFIFWCGTLEWKIIKGTHLLLRINSVFKGLSWSFCFWLFTLH